MSTNRNTILVIISCLFFGAVAGWMIRGGEEHPDREHTHNGEDGVEYTCSMHPQIRQNEPGQCPLCGMALVPVSNKKGGDSNPFVMEMTSEAVALANVQTTSVKSGLVTGELTLTGKIQINERGVKSLTANYSGRVDQLFVNFTGQEVQKGQKLATLYSPELVNAQKELLETAKIKDKQPALYQATKEKLRLWKISEEQIAGIESSGQVETQFDIFTDVSGVVTVRNLAVGDFVNRGTALFEIVDLSNVWVMLDAYESDLGVIRKGDELSFQVAAYPSKEFKAKVTYIDPVLNPDTRTVGIRAEAVNRDFALKPEMFVSANISTTHAGQSGLMIPKTSILWTGPRSVVYVRKGNREAPAFEMREIEIGTRVGDHYLVISGLEEGEQIVSNGVFSIDAAAQLTGNYSMMTKPEVNTLETPEEFRDQLTAFIQNYLPIKDALVNSDAEATQALSLQAKSSLAKVDMNLLRGKAHDRWMELLGSMTGTLDKIAQTAEVEEQRKYFETLSDSLIEAIELFGITGETLFKHYCPMAFRDEGAVWLSGEREVKNPYFGEQMLTCGEIQKTYSSK